jgi:hypothetical protein
MTWPRRGRRFYVTGIAHSILAWEPTPSAGLSSARGWDAIRHAERSL